MDQWSSLRCLPLLLSWMVGRIRLKTCRVPFRQWGVRAVIAGCAESLAGEDDYRVAAETLRAALSARGHGGCLRRWQHRRLPFLSSKPAAATWRRMPPPPLRHSGMSSTGRALSRSWGRWATTDAASARQWRLQPSSCLLSERLEKRGVGALPCGLWRGANLADRFARDAAPDEPAGLSLAAQQLVIVELRIGFRRENNLSMLHFLRPFFMYCLTKMSCSWLACV